ncbi:MAG TPA: helix-hairpin-helix domain-containing protein [Candidatus Angelobacter sp.]
MATKDGKIDINTARVGELTQLPGIAKNTAYNIVNQRQRRGLFTTWEELAEVKGFPAEKLDQIKTRAVLTSEDEGFRPPRHIRPDHLERANKKTAGYTKALRATRRPARMHSETTRRAA